MAGIAAPSVANYFPKSQVGRAGSLDRREEGGDGRYCCTKSGKLFSRIIGRKGRVTGQKGGGWWRVSLHKDWQTLLQNHRQEENYFFLYI